MSAETPAIAFLEANQVAFTPRRYAYEERGGTKVSSQKLGVPEHQVVKTLVMEDETKAPLIVLMHGDRQVSLKQLARQLKVKKVEPCDPAVAQRHTGYLVGGTSPFGTRKTLPIYLEDTIAPLPFILINGGQRGFLVELAPAELIRVLAPTLVHVAAEKES